MGLQSRTDDNGMSDDGEVRIPVPFGGRNAKLYRHVVSPKRTRSTAPVTSTEPVAPTPRPPTAPTVRDAQIIHLPLFQNPHVARAAENHGFSESTQEVNMLDAVMRTFTILGFQPVDSRFNAVLELKKTNSSDGSTIAARIMRDVRSADSLPQWKLVVSSSDGKHHLNSFAYSPEQFREFAIQYATRFQIDDLIQLSFDL